MKIADNRAKSVPAYFNEKLGDRYEQSESEAIALLVLESTFGIKRIDFALNPELRLTESELVQLVRIIERLRAGEPVQYVLGEAFFFGRAFEVNPNVLIPRPETEELVQAVLDEIKDIKQPAVLDCGTGSGCIPITIALERSDAKVSAFDVSEEALNTARSNAKNLNATVEFFHWDLLQEAPERKVHVLVSNPPYIPLGEHTTLSDHVVNHEPHLALFAPDDDPLIFYKRLLVYSQSVLLNDGVLLAEIQFDKGSDLLSVCSRFSGAEYEVIRDMSGKDRILKVRFNS